MSLMIVDDVVKHILTSKVYDIATETPLRTLPPERGEGVLGLSQAGGPAERPQLQDPRAYNKIAHLSEDEKGRVIAASAGNHAQGSPSQPRGSASMPSYHHAQDGPSIKVDAVLGFGAKIELYGDSYSETYEYCKKREVETGRTSHRSLR